MMTKNINECYIIVDIVHWTILASLALFPDKN